METAWTEHTPAAVTARAVQTATSDLDDFIKSLALASHTEPEYSQRTDSDNESVPSLEDDTLDQALSTDSPSITPAVTPDQYYTARIHQNDSPLSTSPSSLRPKRKPKPAPITIVPPITHISATKSPFSPQPVLQSSMVQLSDFNYNRFSVVVHSPSNKSEYDSDEPYSPIEVATPVAYQIPKLRPSVISVRASTASRQSRSYFLNNIPPMPTLRPPPPPRSPHRPTLRIASDGFLAAEATLVELPPSPSPAVLPKSASTVEDIKSQDSAPNIGPPIKTLHRKSSMPLLSTAFKNPHGRVNSLKSLLRSQTSSIDTTSVYSASCHSSRPTSKKSSLGDLALTDHDKAAILSIASPTLSTSTPKVSKRTSSARNTSLSSITALPIPPSPPPSAEPKSMSESQQSLQKKRSSSTLHSRRKSISQVFKIGKSRKQQSTDLAIENPLPVIDPAVGSGRPTTDRSFTFPTTPLPSSSYRTSTVPSFPQTPSRLSSNYIGLGLGRVEEIKMLSRTQSGF